MNAARDALDRLRSGNQRYLADARTAVTDPSRRAALTSGQTPFAIVLSCSDSRVPAELVFDQGLGDLFVVRVAGNIATPTQVGSVEFAAEFFGTRLVVVMGHTQCGAVAATIRHLESPEEIASPYLRSILDGVRPAIAPLLAAEVAHEPAQLAHLAGRANVRAAVDSLRTESAILDRLVREDGLLVVGAEYSHETGEVEFFEGV